jgi:hypothetical protein
MRGLRSSILLFCALSFSLSLASCGLFSDEEAEESTTDPTYPDKIMGHVIVEAYNFLYNQNVAGRSQNVDVETGCPQGGRVSISGHAQEDPVTAVTTVDLVYASVGCRVVMTDHDITITGVVLARGSFKSSAVVVSDNNVNTGLTSLAYTSSLPIVTSGLDQSNSRSTPLEVNCAVAVNQSGKKISGTICGRAFGY